MQFFVFVLKTCDVLDWIKISDKCMVCIVCAGSIRAVLDHRIKISIKRLVKQEVRADKTENRVLVRFSCCWVISNAFLMLILMCIVV